MYKSLLQRIKKTTHKQTFLLLNLNSCTGFPANSSPALYVCLWLIWMHWSFCVKYFHTIETSRIQKQAHVGCFDQIFTAARLILEPDGTLSGMTKLFGRDTGGRWRQLLRSRCDFYLTFGNSLVSFPQCSGFDIVNHRMTGQAHKRRMVFVVHNWTHYVNTLNKLKWWAVNETGLTAAFEPGGDVKTLLANVITQRFSTRLDALPNL